MKPRRSYLPFVLLSLSAAVAFACSADGGGQTEENSDGDEVSSDSKGDLAIDISSPASVNCGDGALTDDEACDDGNNESDDGCFANCLGIDPGFVCPFPGELCIPFAKCGDGVVSFPEQCDDGGEDPGDGCSSTCKIEVGFKCEGDDESPSSCSPTVCGDGVIEGAETCDNGPDVVGDGCSNQCIGEPDCSGGACLSSCGDGLVLGEECDDGNLTDGDGCSSTCTVEAGYECTQATDCERDASGNCALTVPVVYRDFSETHEDFESCSGNSVTTGMVESLLVDGKPVPSGETYCKNIDQWYVDSDQSTTHVGEIVLYDNGEGGFVNRWGPNGEQWSYYDDFEWVANTLAECEDSGCVPCPWSPGNGCSASEILLDGNPMFFPVDGIDSARDDGGFEAQVSDRYWDQYTWERDIFGEPVLHNFHFTTEVTYWFPYDETTNATLEFTGDDDVWVFVNGHLAVDLGGVHEAANGSVTINTTTASSFGLSPGSVYEIKVFHAERKTTASSFRLTLEGFSAARSDCKAVCGDGIIGFGEQCDDGVNDGGHNECQPGCLLGTYCGNGVVDEGEACDDADPNAPSSCAGCRIVVVQ